MEWEIVGTDGKYFISDDGRVYSHVDNHGNINVKYRKERKQQETIWGYKTVDLAYPNKRKKAPIHRLVAEHFINNPYCKPCVNHIDGNKHNNHVSNLEWVTHSENEKHSYKILGKKPNKTLTGIGNPKPIKDPDSGIIYKSAVYAQSLLGISRRDTNKFIKITREEYKQWLMDTETMHTAT